MPSMGDVMEAMSDNTKEKTPTEQLLTNSLRREHEVSSSPERVSLYKRILALRCGVAGKEVDMICNVAFRQTEQCNVASLQTQNSLSDRH